MNRDKLKEAIIEAERFLKRAKALPEPVERRYYHKDEIYLYDNFPVEWGAIRRSSMDLTRALASLRKS